MTTARCNLRHPNTLSIVNSRIIMYLLLAPCLFLLSLGLLACPSDAARSSNGSGGNVRATVNATSPPPSSTKSGQATVAFDGARAFAHVSKLVSFGPRPAGSVQSSKAREYIVGELRSYNLKVTLDEFQVTTPVGKRKMVNIIAELPGERQDQVVLASHYDTKPYKEFRFVGANDGGSSTGVLLELARVMAASANRPAFTRLFVFFDGEEAFCANWDDCGTPAAPDNTYGSRRFVSQRLAQGDLKSIRAMILLDMVGYRNLELGRDTMSTRWLVDTIWQTAKELGYAKQFVDRDEAVGGDDHEPFLRAGVDAVDLIQLNTYPYWHTKEDTLDKVSAESLKTVGEVVLASLPRIEERLLTRLAS